MSDLQNQKVRSVMLNGEQADLGREMTVSEAMGEMESLGLLGSVAGATPTVVDGVLNFVYERGDKGIA